MALPSEKFIQICSKYTITGEKRMRALWNAVKDTIDIKGDLVEAGVYKGGSSMLMSYALQHFGSRKWIYMYDTFKGMTKPEEKDVKIDKGHPYINKWEKNKDKTHNNWNYASYDEVYNNMLKTKNASIFMVEGDVLKTVPKRKPKHIAVLRLDTDFYKSTKHLMNHLFPLVSPGGYVIIDDYYCWRGAQDAVNEYFDRNGLSTDRIEQVDHSCGMYKV